MAFVIRCSWVDGGRTAERYIQERGSPNGKFLLALDGDTSMTGEPAPLWTLDINAAMTFPNEREARGVWQTLVDRPRPPATERINAPALQFVVGFAEKS